MNFIFLKLYKKRNQFVTSHQGFESLKKLMTPSFMKYIFKLLFQVADDPGLSASSVAAPSFSLC